MEDHLAFVSDMHLAPLNAGGAHSHGPKDLPPRRAARLEVALGQIETLGPAAILLGGDNANQALADSEHLRFVSEFLGRFPEPRRAIPGNHDVGSTIGWAHHDPDHMARSCATFRTHFGPDRWILEVAGFRIMAINSQISGSGLPEDLEQRAWLKAELAKTSPLLRVLFMHTPPYLHGPEDDFDDGSEMLCLRPPARAPLLPILEAHPPDLLITAHVHRYWKCREPHWDWLALPSTAFGQDEIEFVPKHHIPEGDDRVGWLSLRRSGDSWAVVFHAVDFPETL